jgi:hypothetical protein
MAASRVGSTTRTRVGEILDSLDTGTEWCSSVGFLGRGEERPAPAAFRASQCGS